MFKPRVHYHARNMSAEGETYGCRLEPDDLIDEDSDVYESETGQWRPCKGLHDQKAGALVVVRRLPVMYLPSSTP